MGDTMAEGTEAAKQPNPDAAYWRGFGLRLDEEPKEAPDPNAGEQEEAEDDNGGEQESGNGESVDASEADASESLENLESGKEADKGDTGEESLSEEDESKAEKTDKKYKTIAAVKRDLDAEQKKRKAAEEQMRKFQGEKDRLESTVKTLQTHVQMELNRLRSAVNQNNDNGDIPDFDDEAVITGKDLNALKKKGREKQTSQTVEDSDTTERLIWLNARPDIEDVRKHVSESKWVEDPTLRAKYGPTNDVGYYWAARAIQLEKKLSDADTRMKQEVEKARNEERKKLGNRKLLPPTGGSGGAQPAAKLQAINETEKRLLKFFGKDAKIVQRGR